MAPKHSFENEAGGDTMGTMRVLDRSGDTTVAWAVDDPASVQHAEELFDRLAAERKIPFARPSGGEASEAERITAFDASLEEIVWVRPVAGG
jgi:hypothetical protein